MSIGQGMNNAFNMFLAMQQNRNAREDAERQFQYKKQYDERRLGQIDRELAQREDALGIDRINANTRAGQLSLNQQIDARAQDKYNRGILQEDAARILAFGQQEGFIDPVTNRRTPKFDEALRAGDNRARNFLKQIQSRHPERYAEGFVPDTFDFTTNPGSVIAGSSAGGVVTRNATSNANDPVVPVDVDTFFGGIENDIIDLVGDALGNKALNLVAAKGAAGGALDRAEARQAEEEAQAVARQTIASQIYAAGGIEAGRAFEGMVASAKTPEEKRQLYRQLAEDFGLEIPEFTPEAEANTSGAPQLFLGGPKYKGPGRAIYSDGREGNDYYPATGAAEREVSKFDSELERLDKILEGDLSSSARDKFEAQYADVSQRRDDFVNSTNKKLFDTVQEDLEKAKSSLESARPGRKPYWEKRVAFLEGEYDKFVKLGVETPATKTDGWKQLEADVLSRIEGLSPQEVDDLVDRGLLKFTPEMTAALRQRAQELEINSLPAIKKLPTREELAFRAITSVFAEDATSRENARREIDNLSETGFAGMDRYEQETAEINRINAATSRMNAQTSAAGERRQASSDLAPDAIEFSQKLSENMFQALEGEDATGARSAMARYFGPAVTELERYMPRKGNPTGDPNALRIAYQGINAAVSRAFSQVAAGGLGNTLVEDFVGLFTSSPSGESADFDLANIRINPAGNRLSYVGPDGREQGKPVSVGALKNQFPSAAVDLLVAAGKANSALAAARSGG